MKATTILCGVVFALLPAFAAALCGDGVSDGAERCDDGNALGGDGCSSLCQVEAGYSCSAPIVAGDLNALNDGGFEAAAAQSTWNTSVISPLCETAVCGSGSGSGARAGLGWVWFGGQALAGTQHVAQDVVIPAQAVEFRFAVENPVCDSANDVARVLIDGNEIWSTDGGDASCGTVGYRDVVINLATAAGGPYNDNAAHTLRIEASLAALNGGLSNFFFDALLLDVGDAVPTPSLCTQEREVCQAEAFDGLDGDFTSINWSVFNTGAAVVDWGTTDDGVCGSVNGPAGNHTGGAGDAACIDADAAAAVSGGSQIDSYLCAAAVDFTTLSGAAMEFRLNYQVVSDADSGDIFEVLAADTAVPPSAATIAAFTSVYSAGGVNVGEVGLIPGSRVTIDLSSLDGSPNAHICFRYGGRDDWYAQLDDAAIVAASCAATDTDGDGIADATDNCTLKHNPAQVDADGDDIGNDCDADFDNDCRIDFLDLGFMKSRFFSADANADLNVDGSVDFLDLGILKSMFFGQPGPSALGCN